MKIEFTLEHGSCFNEADPDITRFVEEYHDADSHTIWYLCSKCQTSVAVHYEVTR
jgi:hypothetical protein